MEHRWGERRPIDLAVRFSVRQGRAGTGRIINISSSGAFMETRVYLRLLSVLYLTPAEGEDRRIAATVVRYDPRGVGLEWSEFDADTMKSLRLATELQHRGRWPSHAGTLDRHRIAP